jgi:predicted double-glycine peptidase
MPIQYHAIPRNAVTVPLDDTWQHSPSTCGASTLLAVLHYFGVGPTEEEDLLKVMRTTARNGTNPEHLERAVNYYELQFKAFQPMSTDDLKSMLDRGRPVVLMLQAWEQLKRYRKVWNDGHWVTAIGYNREGFFFEDPWIHNARAYLTADELADRWHDVGAVNKHVQHYGLVVWRERYKPRPGLPVTRYRRMT